MLEEFAKKYDTRNNHAGQLAKLLLRRGQKDKNIPFKIDKINSNYYLFVCSPVGNQNALKKPVRLCLSGFCVAPEAAFRYWQYIDAGQDPINAEIANTFNTPTMRRGIKAIFDSLGFKEEYYNEILKNIDSQNQQEWLFTQMLCMISKNGGSSSVMVEEAIRKSEYIRNQALISLSSWFKRITKKLKPGGIILLMGKNAQKNS